jgi:hypothetical protein
LGQWTKRWRCGVRRKVIQWFAWTIELAAGRPHHSLAMKAIHLGAESYDRPRAGEKQYPRHSTRNPMADMIRKRLVVAAFAFVIGLMLGSCSPFSGFVSDHWPHFAGGEPDGVPPRPGEPGYAQFIAHGQPGAAANSTAGNGQPVAAGASSPVIEQRPLGASNAAPSPPATTAPVGATNTNVGQGGLY